MLRANKLSAFYDRTQVLHEIDLRIEEGEIVGLVGANGAGKSTTLRAISGLVKLTSGSIKFLGVDLASLPPHRITERSTMFCNSRILPGQG